jgi:hypothetical protein
MRLGFGGSSAALARAAEAATAGASTSRVDDGNSGRPRAGHGAGRRLAAQSGPPRLSCDPWAPRPRPEARPTRRRCGCTPAPRRRTSRPPPSSGSGGGGSQTYEGQPWRGSGRARTHNRRAQRLAGRSQGTSCTASSHGRTTRPGARGLATVGGWVVGCQPLPAPEARSPRPQLGDARCVVQTHCTDGTRRGHL